MMAAAGPIDPEVLRAVTVFSTCSTEQLARLLEVATPAQHGPGDLLTEEGVMGHRFHLLVEGRAEAERRGQRVGSVGEGEFVGEIGLLGGGAATATVRATASITCLEIRRERFWQLLEEEPAIALRILEVVCRRLVLSAGVGPTANLPG
jgi:CRP/FNR family cyclic AMP-dependent transcriptional regulator